MENKEREKKERYGKIWERGKREKKRETKKREQGTEKEWRERCGQEKESVAKGGKGKYHIYTEYNKMDKRKATGKGYRAV